LTISKAFTAFALFVLVNKPLTVILIAVPLVTSSATSFQRIQDYLNGKERRDMRLTPGKSPSGQPPATSETGGATGAPSTPSKGEKMGLEEAERVGGTTTPSIGKNIIASIDGKFSWADAAEPVIDIRGLEIPSHTFTLLLGTVGCGKSTLVKALLGEISSFQGTIYANYSNVAYCSQSPWISNETVQKTIVGAADFNESWYEEVIRACALEKDVQDWLEGDQTIAGTMGISLSGGQRQRLVCFSLDLIQEPALLRLATNRYIVNRASFVFWSRVSDPGRSVLQLGFRDRGLCFQQSPWAGRDASATESDGFNDLFRLSVLALFKMVDINGQSVLTNVKFVECLSPIRLSFSMSKDVSLGSGRRKILKLR
jgi:ABC-type lipoprotein export system ATPase subunit